MKGIIIAGGLGTRLRPLTYHRPKPLIPVANRPFLEYQVAHLQAHGIDDIVFATNYMASRIEAHFGDGSRFGVRMRYAVEEEPLGTGGAIRNGAGMFPGETVAVFNGDVLADFNLGRVLRFHEERAAIATITLTPIPRPNPFGALDLAEDGRVIAWREPTEEEKREVAVTGGHADGGVDLINAGFYVLAPAFIERIPQGVPRSVERDIYPALLAEHAPVYGIAPGGFWMDVGRPEHLLEASIAVLTRRVQTAIPGIARAASAEVAPTATLSESTAIGPGCRIAEGARLTDCVVFDGVSVGECAVLTGVVIDSGSVIGDNVVIEARAGSTTAPVIASGSHLARGSRIIMG